MVLSSLRSVPGKIHQGVVWALRQTPVLCEDDNQFFHQGSLRQTLVSSAWLGSRPGPVLSRDSFVLIKLLVWRLQRRNVGLRDDGNYISIHVPHSMLNLWIQFLLPAMWCSGTVVQWLAAIQYSKINSNQMLALKSSTNFKWILRLPPVRWTLQLFNNLCCITWINNPFVFN